MADHARGSRLTPSRQSTFLGSPTARYGMVITPAGERIAVADELIVRSSVAEYLTFITATGESEVNAVYADENVWLTQKMMGILYDVGTNTINYHLKKPLNDGESPA